MKVTCPACGTSYLVDARAIGADGRKVRCAKCGEVWLQQGAAPPPEPAPPAVDFTPASPAVAAPGAGIASPDFDDEPAPRINLPAVPPPPRSRALLYGWAAIAAAVLLVIVGAIVARHSIAARWPATDRLYAALGLEAAAPGAGLEFRNVSPTRISEDGEPTLVIEGQVANVSHAMRPVPKLKAILHDKSDRVLQSWSFPPPRDHLAPGESLSFRTSIARPNDGASGIVVTFDTGT